MKKYLFISFIIFLIATPLLANSKGLVPCSLHPKEGEHFCTFCDIFVLFNNVVNYLLLPPPSGGGIVFILAILLVAIGGFMYVFAYVTPSEGGPEMLGRAKSLFKSVAIGLLIIYGAWLFVNTFFMLIGVSEWTGLKEGWWQIKCP